eukprot:gnl/TRDRNA2_/TRDRNA2_84149_c0_seq1.p1 gnl/TRDRNA2_/TRDRNA2_84149_c0~~gnl/TRDRNA2_/TRDRNA2_84149_c0_seq1.p1  ORF type:complete len:575 (+),score=64.41 gnl/TRDRNA2_/TRDRNA2_84149_c0_seq1:86-1810(+)
MPAALLLIVFGSFAQHVTALQPPAMHPQEMKVESDRKLVADQTKRALCEIRPCADEMSITKIPPQRREGTRMEQLDRESMPKLIVPGLMASTSLYVHDVMLLPKENSIAIVLLGKVALEGLRSYPDSVKTTALEHAADDGDDEHNVTLHMTELPLALPSVADPYSFKCEAIVDYRKEEEAWGSYGIPDASHILLCRALGVDLKEKLTELQRSERGVLEVQLGSEVVDVSAWSLSAAQHTITRRYRAPSNTEEASRKSNLTASVVIPVFGPAPLLYLNETMQYLNASGMSHVYVGVWKEAVHGTMKSALRPYIASGFVSFLDLDAFPGNFDWRLQCRNFFYKGMWSYCKQDVAKQIVWDWALYHAKSFDDLLLIHDYDELIVPDRIATVPTVIQELSKGTAEPNDLCYFQLCPFETYGGNHSLEARGKQSRADDFPIMDGGDPTFDLKDERKPTTKLLTPCRTGGFADRWSKAIAVTRNVYKIGKHMHKVCSANVIRKYGDRFNETGGYMFIERKKGLHLQHFSEQFANKRWVKEQHSHDTSPSTFSRVWHPFLNRGSFEDPEVAKHAETCADSA